uniref:Peptidase S1 domain-containing protein n=1 Tax=Nothoprocta perdicaria TaxID=30464 RepID=A0A8C6YTE2_NOTPE
MFCRVLCMSKPMRTVSDLSFSSSVDQDRYYNATFVISNVYYDPYYQRQTTEQFRHLSEEIESTVNWDLALFLLICGEESCDSGSSLDQRQGLSSWPSASRWQSRGSLPVGRFIIPLLPCCLLRESNDSDHSKRDAGALAGDCQLRQSCPLSAGCGLRRQMTTFSGVERIAGGQLARDGEWPWQASIQLDGIHRCGASVISNTWLLTAAHCFRGGTDPRRWTASFGTLLRPPTQKRFVRNIIIHEGYNDHLHNHEDDVALVELASPIKFTSDVHSVCLPEASHEFPDNASCFVTGWGALSNDGYSVNQLRQAEVKIISTRICNMGHVYHGVITPGMLCAGYLEGQVDACQGDSGGPLVHANSRGIWYLVGIVSWGDECGKLNKPGVYTRVTYYRDWITSKTNI